MKKIALMLFGIALFGVFVVEAQVKSLSGTVTSSEDGTGIPGVSVVVKGTTVGSVTNIDGYYQFDVPNDAQTIIFSFVGMKSIEKPLVGSTIDAVLEPDYVGVEEVIVTGYASHKKSEITGSSVQVSGADLADMPVVSIDQALQGRVAGVNVSSASGTPGSAQNVRIRGRSSITAGNQPLYVVDGVPIVDGNVSAGSATSSLSMLATINSNDIETITVLKDASATAAYGARGANGVIVITTKSGKAGEANINFSATYGFSNDAIEGPRVLTGADREMLYYEGLINSYGEDEGFSDQAGAKKFYEDNPGAFGTDYVRWNAAGAPETYWPDHITNDNAIMQEYNLSASGGSGTTNYYISGGYLQQEATVIGSEYERFSGAVSIDTKLNDKLTFATRNTASHNYQDGLLESSAYFSSPRAVKYFMPSIDQAYNEDGSLNLNLSLPNPMYVAQENIDESKFTRILSNNTLTWETPVKNLTFSTRMTIDYQVYNYKSYYNPIEGDGVGSKGEGWAANRNRANYVFQNSLDYVWDLENGHSFDFKLIQEYQKNRLSYLEGDADNFADVGLTNLNSAGNPTFVDTWFTDWSIASYLGLVHYSYEGKYVADLTYRKEGSSRFSPDNRWGDFWAIGGAWNINREDFMANTESWLNMLKLRGSYGVTGNANISLNQYQALLNYDSSYASEGASYPGTFGNDDLSWETSNTLDIGIDYGFMDNKITGSFGYYNRETQDMLLDVPLSLTTGFDEQTRNIGRMENKGFEMDINIDILRSKDMNFSIGGNFGTNANEILELSKDINGEEVNITSTTTRVESGHPVYGWYMPTWAGVNSETGDEMWFIDGEGSETTSNFNDANQVWQGGSAIPTITAGMNLHFDYKGVFLDVNGYYAGGHKVYEGWHRYTHGTDVFSVAYYQGLEALLDRWQKPGDVTRNGKFEDTGRPWQRHSKFLYDGDYFRLKDMTFGYDFNRSTLEKIRLGGLRVFVRGTNLATWVKDDNLLYDPETDTDGETGMATPPAKSFIFGVNVKF